MRLEPVIVANSGKHGKIAHHVAETIAPKAARKIWYGDQRRREHWKFWIRSV
jgi:hypothetical protein